MKVLLRDTFLPGNTYSLELCKCLKSYADVVLLCKEDAGNIDGGITFKKIIYTKSSNKFFSLVKYIKSICREIHELRKGEYDVYHIQSYKNLLVEIFMFYTAKKYCKAVVTTVHNVLPHEVSKLDRNLHKQWYKISDALIVHNEATRECLVKLFPFTESKIAVVPHGAYSNLYNNNQTEYTEREPKIHFLLFGQMRPYKGIDILIQAIPYLKEEIRKKIRITIAGNQLPGQDRTDYAEMIRKYHSEDCIDFQKRRVPDEELPELFEKADFCLFPYKEIYGSGALLMAYTYDKPVIASNVPAFIEETDNGRTGILFSSGNPKELAEAIERAVSMNKEEIASYKAAITELVQKKYNWSVSAQKTFEIYDKILKKHNSSSKE